MKQLVRTLLCTAMLLAATLAASAQSVQVMISQKVASLPSTATSYIDDPFRYFNVQMVVSGAGAAGVDVFFDLSFSITNLSATPFIFTRENSYPSTPLHLNEGVNLLTKDQLINQLSGRTSTQIDMSNPLLAQQLPEGQYQLCITPWRWSERTSPNRTPMTLGNNCYIFNICYTGSAPEFVSPIAGAQLGLNGFYELTPSRKLTFRWTPVISNCAGKNTRFNYRLKVVKVLQGQNYQDAIDQNPTVFSAEVRDKTFVMLDTLLDCKVNLERSALYVAQVAAEQIETANSLERMTLSNEGKSQLSTFYWGKAPDDAQGNADDGGGNGGEGGDGHTTWQVKTTVVNDADQIMAQTHEGYVLDFGIDSTAYNRLVTAFPSEAAQLPNPLKDYKKENGIYMVPDNASTEISFMPLRHDSLQSVDRWIKLYEYVGNMENTLARQPIESDGFYFSGDAMKTSNHTAQKFDIKNWKKKLQCGGKYYLEVVQSAYFHTHTYTINDTTFYVDNIKAETVRDTVRTAMESEFRTFTSGILFQWGVDSSLFEQVTTAQIRYPVDLTKADVTDTHTYNNLPESIPIAVKTEEFNVTWKPASGILYGDTAIYYIVVKELKDKQTLAAAWKKNDTLMADTVKHQSFLTTEDTAFYNKLVKGKRYIMEVTTTIQNKTKTDYHFVNGNKSLKAVFEIDDPYTLKDELTTSVTCFAKDTVGLDKKNFLKIHPDTIARRLYPIHLGKFKLFFQKAKLDEKAGTYSGEGYIMWNPLMVGQFGVKVTFKDIKINKDTIAVAGYAKSMNDDSLGYIKLGVANDTSTKCGDFDMYSDKAVSAMNAIANEMGEDGKEVKKWYDRVNKSANIIGSLVHSDKTGQNFGVYPTPLKLGGDMLGTNSDNLTLQVNNMYFSPTTAIMSIVGIWSAPADHVYVPLVVTNVCTEPDVLISNEVEEVNIVLPRNYDIELSNGHIFRFKAPTDFAKLEDGCFVKFNRKEKYQGFNVEVEYEFGKPNDPNNKLVPIDNNGKIKPGQPVCGSFATTIVNWKEFVVRFTMDGFSVVGMEDYSFVPGGKGFIYDHSETFTPPQIRFPEGYKYKGMTVDEWMKKNLKRDDKAYEEWLKANVQPAGKRAKMLREYQEWFENNKNQEEKKGNPGEWQGFYIDKFSVFLPPSISNAFSDKDTATHKLDTVKYVRYSGANNEEVADTVYYTTTDYRMHFTAERMVFEEDNGISLSINAVNLFDAETKKGGGWAFSLDTIGLVVLKNHFKDARICGTMGVPFFKERMKYKCAVGQKDLVFSVTPTKDELTLELFSFKMKFAPSSHFNITHRFKPDDGNPATLFDLTLNGTLNFDYGEDSKITLSGIKFENLWLRNYADDATRGYFAQETIDKYNSEHSPQEQENMSEQQRELTKKWLAEQEKLAKGAAKGKIITIGGTYMNLGVWSKASPQKGIGNYSNQAEYDAWLADQQKYTDRLVEYPDGGKDGKGKDGGKDGKGKDGDKDGKGEKVEGENSKNGKMGPFSFNLSTFEVFFADATGDAAKDALGFRKFGINFAGNVAIEIGSKNSVGANGGFQIWTNAMYDEKGDSLVFDSVYGKLDSIEFECDMYGFGVDAKLFYKEDDSIYGNGWMGYLKLKVFDKVEVAAACGFGKTRELNAAKLARPDLFDTVYSWWFFEGAAILGKGIPIGPVTLKGFGGGFAWNMALTKSCANTSPSDMRKAGAGKSLTDGMVASTGLEFTPGQDSWVAKAGIAMCVGDETACDMSGILTLRIVNGHFGGISMMVNAKILAHYDKKADSTDLATVNVAVFMDYTDEPDEWGQFSFSAAVEGGLNLKNFLDSNEATTASIKNAIKTKTEGKDGEGLSKLKNFISPSSAGQKVKQEKTAKEKKDEAAIKKDMDSIYTAQSQNLGGSLTMNVPIELYVKAYKGENRSPVTGEESEWYFALGMPTAGKRISFGLDANLVVAKAKVLFEMYFMFGNYFPDSVSIPALPKEVRDFLGSDYNPGQGRQFTSFGQGGGVTFGAAMAANLKINMALYVDVNAYLGFDVALQKTKGKQCNGHTMGRNGYYAQGQVYAMLKGDIGIGLDLGFWEGHVSLAKAGLGAVLQGGGPNPSWAYGLVKFEAELLGGLCKISTNFDFKLGNVCIEGAGDPMANVKLFQDVSPGYNHYSYADNDNIVSPLVRGVVVSNMPWNEALTLSVPRTNGIDVDERKFKFVMVKPGMAAYKTQNYQRRDIGVTSPTAANFTRSNFGSEESLKMTQSQDDPNTYYFENRNGYFTAASTYQVYLWAFAMEYRKYAKGARYTFKATGTDKYDDYVINQNNADLHSANTHPNAIKWRDPLYEHDGKKTVKRYIADTLFFFNTGGLPNTLDDQVLFTWPYNGDPMVPYDCFPKEGTAPYITIAMKVDRNDIFNENKLNKLGKKLKVYMLKKGQNGNTVKECTYSYLSNGIQGNGVPTLKVVIPSAFRGDKAREQAFALQVMTISDEDYNNAIKQMAKKAQQAAAKTKVTYEQHEGRDVKNMKSGSNDRDLKQIQQQTLKDAYEGMNADTLLNVKKTELSEYDIMDRSGVKVYSLYYHVTEYANYSDLLNDGNKPYIKTTRQYKNGYTYTSDCIKTPGLNKSNTAYLFEPWKPNNSRLYATDVTLPAICHLVVDQKATSDVGNVMMIEHRRLTMRLIKFHNDLKKLTYVQSMPDWMAVTYKFYAFETWYNFGKFATYDWSGVKASINQGLVKSSNSATMNAIPYRLNVDKWDPTTSTTLRSNAITTGFDYLKYKSYSGGDTIYGYPAVVSVKLTNARSVVDSAAFFGNRYQASYTSRKNMGVCCLWMCRPSNDYNYVDYATPAIVKDVYDMRRFFKDVYDYSISIMGMNMKTRADNMKSFYKSGKTYTKHNFGHNFPYTIPEVSIYSAYYQAFNWNYRSYWHNTCDKYAPITMTSRSQSDYGEKVALWYKDFIYFDKFPVVCEDKYGMLYTRTITLQSQGSGTYNIASYYGHLANSIAWYSKGFSGKGYVAWMTPQRAKWILNIYYAQIDGTNNGKTMLVEMINKTKEFTGKTTPVILANKKLNSNIEDYYTYPVHAMDNAGVAHYLQVQNQVSKARAEEWRDDHKAAKKKNTLVTTDYRKK